MKNTDSQVITKLMEIAELKKEVIKLMIPEQTYKHFEVIGNEIKAMLIESVSDTAQNSEKHSSLKKVNID